MAQQIKSNDLRVKRESFPKTKAVEKPSSDTDYTLAAAPQDDAPLRARYDSTSRPSSFGQHLREKWPEVFLGIISLILLSVMGALWLQVFSLNREVGETRAALTEVRAQQQRLEMQLDKLNDRFDGVHQHPLKPPPKR